jgi:hypothetical protein
MCLACEDDSIWIAYLESRGLLKADDPESVEAFFASFPVQPLPVQPQQDEPSGKAPEKSPDNPFSCDDPNAG